MGLANTSTSLKLPEAAVCELTTSAVQDHSQFRLVQQTARGKLLCLQGWQNGTAEVSSLNEPHIVGIEGRDAYGNRVSGGFQSNLTYTINSAGTVTFADVADGYVEMTFTGTSAGSFSIEVSLSGTQIAGSPLLVDVDDATNAVPANTMRWGSFLDGVCLRLSHVQRFQASRKCSSDHAV